VGTIASARFSPYGNRLLTASSGWLDSEETHSSRRTDDQTARIWDVATSQALVELPHTEGLSEALWSPNGEFVLTISKKVRLWDARSGQFLSCPESQVGTLQGGTLSSDGKYFLGYGWGDGILGWFRVWETEGWKQMLHLEVSDRNVFATLTPDGQTIVASSGPRIRTWPRDPFAAGKARKSRDLTPDEVIEYEIGTEGERRAYQQAWHVNALCHEARLARDFLKLHPEHAGMKAYLAQVLRELVTRLAEGDAKTLTAHALDWASRASAALAKPEPEISGSLAELGALNQRYEEEVLLRHEVTAIVDELFRSKFWTEDVVAELMKNATLDLRRRDAAIRMARGRKRPTADDLNGLSRSVVRENGRSREAYDQALKLAEAASRLEPGNTAILNTLGVAQYRVEQYGAALSTLTRADELNRAHGQRGWHGQHSRKEDLLFMAMSHFRLGHRDEARKLFKEVKPALLLDPVFELNNFIREAETLLSSE